MASQWGHAAPDVSAAGDASESQPFLYAWRLLPREPGATIKGRGFQRGNAGHVIQARVPWSSATMALMCVGLDGHIA